MSPWLIVSLRDARSQFEQGTSGWVALDEAIRVIEQAQVVNGRLQAEVERLRKALALVSDVLFAVEDALNPPKPEEAKP